MNLHPFFLFILTEQLTNSWVCAYIKLTNENFKRSY